MHCPTSRNRYGSSPRMRGTLRRRSRAMEGSRFIPAYAGNTPAGDFRWIPSPVHPRVCGEHILAVMTFLKIIGSSPRMRGTQDGEIPRNHNPRFIPAYAGNTAHNAGVRSPLSVHPRVCGEHGIVSEQILKRVGSSPRMRGTRKAAQLQTERKRFIPAYAGNTASTPETDPQISVHPRVCGEH